MHLLLYTQLVIRVPRRVTDSKVQLSILIGPRVELYKKQTPAITRSLNGSSSSYARRPYGMSDVYMGFYTRDCRAPHIYIFTFIISHKYSPLPYNTLQKFVGYSFSQICHENVFFYIKKNTMLLLLIKKKKHILMLTNYCALIFKLYFCILIQIFP